MPFLFKLDTYKIIITNVHEKFELFSQKLNVIKIINTEKSNEGNASINQHILKVYLVGLLFISDPEGSRHIIPVQTFCIHESFG